MSYYRRCVAAIKAKIDAPFFYVFSDDPVWVASNFFMSGSNVSIVTHNGPHHAFEDLRLMTHCQNHIIANSTFSWWGAWLSPYPDKIVLAPRRWFTDPRIDTSDLIPSDWIRM